MHFEAFGETKANKNRMFRQHAVFYFPLSYNVLKRKMSYTIIYITKYTNLFICVLVYFFTASHKLQSQTKDTTAHQLQEVIITQTKQEQFETSKKNSSIDSLTLSKYNTSNLADLLSNQSTVHIKSYGNGNIATTSIRGGSANHTALLWNGLNIQNAMLGQPDLSIVPSALFNSISLEYGGGSAMWGSGAIGGSIHLQNNLLFNQGYKTKLQLSVGSFETKKINSGIFLSLKKIASNTNLYYNGSENNYNYIDTTDRENTNKQLSHANYIAKGLMQEFSIFITPFQKINLRGWYNVIDRNLPSYSAIASKQKQIDENLKLSGDWNFHKRNLNSIIRLAYFNDNLNYNDTNASFLVSKSNIRTTIIESDNIYRYKRHQINIGINYTSYKSVLFSSTNYNDTNYYHTLSKTAYFMAYKLTLLNSKLNYNIAIRKEFTTQLKIPFTGNSGIHYQILKLLSLKINYNKSFRQPTLNDLYWNPGGNPNLKPEQSDEVDGGIEFKYSKYNYHVLIEGTYFNRHTNNWIVWLPSDKSYWSPRNIAEVYSRGTETKTELSYVKKDVLLKLIVNTSYVLSTNQKKISENDNSFERQIIYTPRYNGQATFLLKYKNISLLFNNNYTGYRFTSTDNTSWLNPYYIANLKCSYAYSFSSVNIELFCNINNLFNKNYTVVSNRPMPLRNFEAGLSMNYHKQKKVKPNNQFEIINSQ
jgi:vitamin B12 transporter